MLPARVFMNNHLNLSILKHENISLRWHIIHIWHFSIFAPSLRGRRVSESNRVIRDFKWRRSPKTKKIFTPFTQIFEINYLWLKMSIKKRYFDLNNVILLPFHLFLCRLAKLKHSQFKMPDTIIREFGRFVSISDLFFQQS